MQKLESIWGGFLRRMVKSGFSRTNAPKNKKDMSIPVEEIDWAYKFSNENIRKITKSTSIKAFCEKQHLKYIAHVTRLGYNNLQKHLFPLRQKLHLAVGKKFLT